ncbi:hypothetical protein AB0J74_26820 [Asanoa sp. NPDC049573]|uniref:hypothetical protein n=1 Tax=Asanoa sp. NPDC049573 TaxID=3155396 RepID=UPI00343ABF76
MGGLVQPSDPAPTTGRSIWMWAGGLVGLVLAVSMFVNNSTSPPPPAVPDIAALLASPGPSSVMLAGTVILGNSASFTRDPDGGCAGTGAHADIVEGALVVVMTDDGRASGILTDPRSPDAGTCRFSFRLAGLPTGQDRYVVTVADHDPREYAEPDLAAALADLRVD